jgi:hypothetical protein
MYVCACVCVCLIVCDIETATMRWPKLSWNVAPYKNNIFIGRLGTHDVIHPLVLLRETSLFSFLSFLFFSTFSPSLS